MTEEMLKRWTRGELRGEERREVTRWVVRCTDPQLPVLLQGMIREARYEAADQGLASRGGLWSRLVEAWGTMLEAGRAGLTTGLGPSLVLASDDEEVPAEVLSVRLMPAPEVQLRLSESTEAAIYLSSDEGDCVRLWGPAPAQADVAAPIPDLAGGRTTLWAVWGEGLPRRAEALEELLAALSEPGVTREALRLEPGEA